MNIKNRIIQYYYHYYWTLAVTPIKIRFSPTFLFFTVTGYPINGEENIKEELRALTWIAAVFIFHLSLFLPHNRNDSMTTSSSEKKNTAFIFQIHHKTGVSHVVAECFSRVPQPESNEIKSTIKFVWLTLWVSN